MLHEVVSLADNTDTFKKSIKLSLRDSSVRHCSTWRKVIILHEVHYVSMLKNPRKDECILFLMHQ